MEIAGISLYSIQDFFESYAAALENFNSKMIVSHYQLPCLFISDAKTTAFTDFTTLESLFVQGFSFLKQYGIAHARPDVWTTQQLTGKVIKVKVAWKYFNAGRELLYSCDYYYLLHTDKDGKWKIETSVSVNEKERMEAWLETRNG